MIISIVFSTVACSKSTDYSVFAGVWAESDIGWEMGGLILDVAVEKEEMTVTCSLTQSAPSSRVAEFTKKVSITEIEDSTIDIKYEDDCWGNSGTLELTFNKDFIICLFKDIVNDDLAQWGFYENTYKLEKKDDAHDLLVYDMEEYYEKYPEENYTEPAEPIYDTSKASGILAQLGMTEEEFRNSCIPLNPSTHPDIFIKKETTIPFIELQDIERNPNAYIGKHLIFAKNPHEELPCKYCHGEDLSKTPRDSCSHSYSGGWNTAKQHDDGLYYYSQENLNKLVPYELLGRNRFTDGAGYSVIEHDECLIYDMRDNIFSPNITEDSEVVAYMIFNGISNDGKYMLFSMLSCDVIYD